MITFEDLRTISAVATPILIAAVSLFIIPTIKKMNRLSFLYWAKIDCIVTATKSMNGEFRNYSKEWGQRYDIELKRKIDEKEFIDEN